MATAVASARPATVRRAPRRIRPARIVLHAFLILMVAFCCTQFSWKFNLTVLLIFTAGNLLPQQVIIVPLFLLYKATPIAMLGSIDVGTRFSFALFSDNNLLYDQYIGVILIHIVFQ